MFKNWKAAIAFLCGLGVFAAGYGGLALRLSPRVSPASRERAPAVPEADEDECEEAPFSDGADSET